MNAMVDDERDDQGLTRNEDANDDALRRAGDGVRNAADDLGVFADAAHVRDALTAHPWPVAGDALMARLHAVPEDAERGFEFKVGRSRHELDILHDGRPIRVEWRRWVEATATVAVVVAIVALLVRRAGDDIAPADAPNAVDATAASPVSTRPSQDTTHYPAYPGYGPDNSLVDDVTRSITHPSLGMALAGRQFALLDPPNDHFAIVTDSEFRVLDGSGDLPMHMDESAEESRIVARLPGIRGTIAVSGTYAFVAGTSFYSEDQLHVVDVSDPMSPTLVASVPMSLGAWFDGSIVAQGNHVYVMRNDAQLVVFDASDPMAPREVAVQGVAGRSQIHLVGDAVLVPRDVIDVSDPTNPLNRPESAALWPYVEPIHWTVVGTRAYVPDGKSVLVLDVSNPFEMAPIGRIELDEQVSGTYRDGQLVVVRYAAPCCEEGAENNQRSILSPATPEPVAEAPLPPAGTRLYGSVAELVADPPPAGETVWVDAYHGEFIKTYPGWGRFESMSGCPSALVSPLLDKPFLLQLSAFNGISASAPDADDGPVLITAGLDADGQLTPFPDLPRHGRLVLHMGDPALAHCDDAGRIVVVERVAHVFEAKPDWTELHQAIRESENDRVIEREGPIPNDDEVEAQLFLDAGTTAPYMVAVPDGLDQFHSMREDDGLPYPDVELLQRSDQPGGSFRIGEILLRRYVPGHAAYDGRRRELGDRIENGPIYTQRDTTGRPLKTGAGGPGLEFTIIRTPSDGSGWTKVRAIAGVGSILYEFEARFTDDAISAQGFLWRFEAVVDRFRVPDATADAPVAEPSPTGLKLSSVYELGHRAESIAADDGLAIVGGTKGLKALSIDSQGLLDTLTTHAPRPPAQLGWIRDADIDVIARQVTSGDRSAARAQLEDKDGLWTVQAVAIRPPYAYAAVEWPPGSSLTWLYDLGIAKSGNYQAFYDATRLASAGRPPLRYVSAYDMAIAGDHLLVATSAGLFDVDISTPASPVVRAPTDGPLSTVITAVAAAPDGRHAWACGGQIDAGSITTLDLSDPGGIRVLGTRPEPQALLDCATDGSTLFASTGSETHAIARYDVSGGGAPRPVDEIVPANGIGIGLHLFGGRLVVSATDISGVPEDAYPAPIDPLGPGRTGLLVYDVSRFDAPIELGAIPLPGVVHDLATAGPFLLAAAGDHGVYIYQSTDEAP